LGPGVAVGDQLEETVEWVTAFSARTHLVGSLKGNHKLTHCAHKITYCSPSDCRDNTARDGAAIENVANLKALGSKVKK